MKTNSLQLLQALNAAAAVLQQTTRSERDVLDACREEIARLGYRGGISLLDDTGESLVVKAIVQPKWMVHIIANLEKRAGYKSKDYSFPIKQVSVYRQAIETRKAVFAPDSSVIISQLLPESIRSLAGTVIKAIGAKPGIYAPMVSQGQAIGVFNIVGDKLTPDDVPTVEAFTNLIAIALDNANLFDALYKSERRYRALFEYSPISIWEEDLSLVKQRIDALRKQGVKDFRSYFESHPQEVSECAELARIVDVNKATLEIYHAEKKEDMLKNLKEVLSNEALINFQQELVSITEGKTSLYWEGTDKTLDGEPIEVSMSWLVAPGNENDLSKVIVSLVDITERMRAETERENLIANLEAQNAELERFVYTLSHDLKAPLVTINGFLGYLEEDFFSGNLDHIKKNIKRIDAATKKMQRLLDELLDLSRIGRMISPPERSLV